MRATGDAHREAALNRGWESELRHAMASRQPAEPLIGFLRRHPNASAPLREQAVAALTAEFGLYRERLQQRFNGNAPPAMLALFDNQLARVVKGEALHLPIKFIPPIVADLDGHDAWVAKTVKTMPGRRLAKMAKHFNEEAMHDREAEMARALRSGLESLFPPGSMRRHKQANPNLEWTAPGIVVEYIVAPYLRDGEPVIYADAKQLNLYAGVTFTFRVELVVPGAESLRFTMEAVPPSQFTSRGSGLRLGAGNDASVYEAMATVAFRSITTEAVGKLGMSLTHGLIYRDHSRTKASTSE